MTNQKKKPKLTLLSVYLLVGSIPLLCSVLLLSIMTCMDLRKELIESTQTKLEVACNGLQQYYELDWGHIDYSDFSFVDSMLEQEVELTLFEGDTRKLSSIKNERGDRIVGTQAGTDIIQAVLQNGHTYQANGVMINGESYYAVYTPIRMDGEIVGMTFAGEKEANVNAALKSMILKFAIIVLLATVLFMGIIVYVSYLIKRRFSGLTKALTALAKGELSEEISIQSNIREIQDLGECTTQVRTNLRAIVENTNTIVNTLSESIHEVENLSGQVAESADQINGAMEELSTGAMGMAEAVQNVNAEAISIGQGINDITEDVTVLNTSSAVIQEVSTQAEENIQLVFENSTKSIEAVEEISAQVYKTNESIDKINAAVKMIQDIAAQTKLLSLNASIEAARAGEAGKGFAVVADNIGQLSQQSSDGARAIQEIAEEIFQQSDRSVTSTEQIKGLITEEQEKIQHTQQVFLQLKEEIEKSLEEIAKISTKTISLDESKGSIVGNVEDLSAVSEQNAASNEEVTASVQTLTEAIQQVNDRAEQMTEMADQLLTAISVFQL